MRNDTTLRRLEYVAASAICVLNIIGMFLVIFGAAAGDHVALLLWPAIVLLAGGILLLTLFSAIRASQVGLSPWATSIATILMCGLGPAVVVLVIYLAMRDEKNKISKPAPPFAWFRCMVLLFAPWILLWGIKYVAAGS